MDEPSHFFLSLTGHSTGDDIILKKEIIIS